MTGVTILVYLLVGSIPATIAYRVGMDSFEGYDRDVKSLALALGIGFAWPIALPVVVTILVTSTLYNLGVTYLSKKRKE